MANQGELQFALPKIDDLTAYELVKSIQKHFEVLEPINIKLAHAIRIAAENYGEENILPTGFKIHEMILNGTSQKTGHNINFMFMRYGEGKPDYRTDPRYDYASLTLGGDPNYWSQNPGLAIEASELISRLTIPPSGQVGTDESEVFRQLIISHDTAHRRMLDDLNKSLVDLGNKRAELELEAATTEKARKAAHDEAQKQLEQQKAELDRQSHLTARRQLSETLMKKSLQGRSQRNGPRLSARVNSLYVFLAAIALGTGAGFVSYQGILAHDQHSAVMASVVRALEQVNPPEDISALIEQVRRNSTVTDWYLILRSVLASFVSIGAFTYAAAWMKRYHDEDITAAREQERYEADIGRASWVIEAIHEVKHEAKGELPPEWVVAVTRNLFNDHRSGSDLDEGSLALKALMGLSANVSVGPNGLTADLNKRGLKEIGKAGD